ncbi:hypothetical protein [Streptomyces cahuitamycinicus]|uniref:Uncharacterized protein n=1 Tax=Streptomyces cahuitamycinicus TaxID=2070367 RepID=A0A2N8TNM3_9ACTN|nr:hypothetical protein [Streptomyces cahuitamycinicus]PNG20622.1 hypothetical protein C1J00_19225 [Streptomyces cahuitamycinicus]
MTDMTRPPGDQSPDARGESAPGTGHRPAASGTDRRETARGLETNRGAARDLPTDRGAARDLPTDRGGEHGTDTGHGVPPATDADRAAAHGTDVPGTGLPGTDRHGTDRDAIDTLRGDHGTGPGKAGPAKAGPAKDRAHLLAHDESDKLGSQLQHAVAGFVDGPRAAVEEADHVLEEIAARFTEAVTQRRRTLRHSWQSVEGGESRSVSSADTEQLRLALKDYRELAERLLHV